MTSKLLFLTFLAGCVEIDTATDELDMASDEAELGYCPDHDCEPPRGTPPKPDLIPQWTVPCRYVYVTYPRPHYEVALAIKNTGDAASTIHLARVVFRRPYDNWTSTPREVYLGALAPGASTGTRLEVPCWNHVAGCEIKITADAANANVESNEWNNTKTWFCPKT